MTPWDAGRTMSVQRTILMPRKFANRRVTVPLWWPQWEDVLGGTAASGTTVPATWQAAPRLAADSVRGRRVHISSSGPCLENMDGVVGVDNPGRPITTNMLPDVDPHDALLCFYSPPGRSLGSYWASPSSDIAYEMAEEMVSGEHAQEALMGCTFTVQFEVLVAFSFAPARNVDVWVTLFGCDQESNGL